MAPQTNIFYELEALQSLVSSSIEIVKENVLQNGDPPLSLQTLEEHPLHRRNDPRIARAMKNVSSAAEMLKALLDPNTFLNDIVYGVSGPATCTK